MGTCYVYKFWRLKAVVESIAVQWFTLLKAHIVILIQHASCLMKQIAPYRVL